MMVSFLYSISFPFYHHYSLISLGEIGQIRGSTVEKCSRQPRLHFIPASTASAAFGMVGDGLFINYTLTPSEFARGPLQVSLKRKNKVTKDPNRGIIWIALLWGRDRPSLSTGILTVEVQSSAWNLRSVRQRRRTRRTRRMVGQNARSPEVPRNISLSIGINGAFRPELVAGRCKYSHACVC